jgi:hypothetical protein
VNPGRPKRLAKATNERRGRGAWCVILNPPLVKAQGAGWVEASREIHRLSARLSLLRGLRRGPGRRPCRYRGLRERGAVRVRRLEPAAFAILVTAVFAILIVSF